MRMRIDLSRHVPPGFPLKPELQFYFTYLIIQVIVNLILFFSRYHDARERLYWKNGLDRTLMPEAVMPDLVAVLQDTALYFFLVLILCMPLFAVIHYVYHRQGSKSIYLMRRLPDRRELHRRCLTLPLAGLVLCVLAFLLLLLVFYWVYMTFTPEQCLTPHQWQKIWSVIL